MESELFVEVADHLDNPLPGALGTLTSKRSQDVRTLVSNVEGQIRFVGLAPGDYDLTVAIQGFATASDDDIPVRRDEPRRIRIVLQPAEIES